MLKAYQNIIVIIIVKINVKQMFVTLRNFFAEIFSGILVHGHLTSKVTSASQIQESSNH